MNNIDYAIIGGLFGCLLVIDLFQIKKNIELQTQIDKLKIIVDQKFLPALILDPLDIR